MAQEKKYYWIKLKTDFFGQKAIKKLRRIAGGDTYVIIYLKMQLLSLSTEGKLYFEGIEDSFAEELALALDEDTDNVNVALSFLAKNSLIEQVGENEYYLPEVPKNTGKEGASAQRVRRHRALNGNNKTLQCNTDTLQSNTDVTTCNALVTKCNTEIEKEKEKDIELELEREREREKTAPAPPTPRNFLNITDEAYKHLCDTYTASIVDDYIDRVYTYSREKNKHYADNALTVKKWIDEDAAKGKLVVIKTSHDVDEWTKLAMATDPSIFLDDKK